MFVDIFDHHKLPTAWKNKGDGEKRCQLLNNNDAEIKCEHIWQHVIKKLITNI